jgi:hypothetical protein
MIGNDVKVSAEAKVAASHLLSMLERRDIAKETILFELHLIGGASEINFLSADAQNLLPFPIPLADVKELHSCGAVVFQLDNRNDGIRQHTLLILPEQLKEVAGPQIPSTGIIRVFYSWQSWTPGNLNRNFIQPALEQAAKSIRSDDSLEIEPVVDRDTKNEAGSVDIAATIFRKITESHIFVCDTTIVTKPGSAPSPNPNVLIELGFAVHALGWERIICVINTTFGGPELMPFDLRGRRLLPYHLADGDSKEQTKRGLTSSLSGALREIIIKHTNS